MRVIAVVAAVVATIAATAAWGSPLPPAKACLHSLGRVPGSAFEVVDTASLRP